MKPALYLVFLSGLCCFTQGSSDFHHITLSKTYNDAKNYCREMYTDLATIFNLADVTRLNAVASNSVNRAWIGLELGDEYTWHWSWPDQKLDFFNWNALQPQNNNDDSCAAMDQHGEWFESVCTTSRSFVCHSSGDSLTFVAETKSWRDAQKHCRDLLSDLVSIHSAEENEAVQNVSESQNVWIGLFKDRWKWSDGSTSSFRFWKPSQPNYLQGQDCTAVVFNDGKWNDLRCDTKRSFVCRGAEKSTSSSTSPTNATSTVKDPVATSTPTVPATASPSRGANVTTNVTVNTATVSELTTPNTTDSVSVTLSPGFNTATTEMSPVTAGEPPPSTTDAVPALTTPMGTSPQPSENSPGNLILIQENMTWIEAMRYCRVHYTDLVHITTEDVQAKVAEKLQNATSAHVWLGLRYTCNFNFWFWISSSIDCYMNWAPGQGPDGEYDCGVTGAIQATGRQQWVGLPETEKLNFICSSCPG